MAVLENTFFRFDCDPEQGCFDLWLPGRGRALIESGRLSVIYRQAGQRYEALNETWQTFSADPETVIDPLQGRLHLLRVGTGADRQGIYFQITFALCDEHPLFLWKIEIENRGVRPAFLDRLALLQVGVGRGCGALAVSDSPATRLAFYSHGWQSWNWSATYAAGQTSRRTNLGLLEAPMYICQGTPQPRHPGHYSGDFFGVLGDCQSRSGWLAGFLSQKEHFGSLEVSLLDPPGLKLWANGDGAQLDPGQRVETDWAVIQPVQLDDSDPLGPFVEAVARQHRVRVPASVPAGWCSWYYYYQNISAAEVRQNLQAVRELKPRLPLDLVQIDDGFERQVGDWFDFQPGFPQGVAPLAAEIQRDGFQPGLWLAPFIVHPRSRLMQTHPEYMLRDARGRLVRSGFNWNAITTALDLTRPDALEYACRVVKTAAQEWGYPYLKLDFLYAGGLPGKYHDPHLSRAQVLRHGLEALREAAGPDTYLLGCGTPLGTSIGLFEAMRIGADVAGSWAPKYLGFKAFFGREPHMPSLRNAVQNTLTRAMFHGRWWINDPDCLLVRPDTELTLAEVQSLAAVIGMTGGSLLLSDDLPALPPERLRIAEVLLPLVGKRPRVLDWFDAETPQKLRLDLDGPAGAWQSLAWFNWQDRPVHFTFQPEDFGMPAGAYWLRSFWDGRIARVAPGVVVDWPDVPAHGSLLLAARPVEAGPQYLGTDLHFSQGCELAEWQPRADGLSLRLALPRERVGSLDLWLPRPPQHLFVDGEDTQAQTVQDGVSRIAVRGQSLIEIEY